MMETDSRVHKCIKPGAAQQLGTHLGWYRRLTELESPNPLESRNHRIDVS
jgi:hypothetical protein